MSKQFNCFASLVLNIQEIIHLKDVRNSNNNKKILKLCTGFIDFSGIIESIVTWSLEAVTRSSNCLLLWSSEERFVYKKKKSLKKNGGQV